MNADRVTGWKSKVLVRFDEQIVPGTSVSDLNPKLWNQFRTVLSARAERDFLEKMKLIATDEDGTMRATVSGILMVSDAYVQRFYSGRLLSRH